MGSGFCCCCFIITIYFLAYHYQRYNVQFSLFMYSYYATLILVYCYWYIRFVCNYKLLIRLFVSLCCCCCLKCVIYFGISVFNIKNFLFFIFIRNYQKSIFFNDFQNTFVLHESEAFILQTE